MRFRDFVILLMVCAMVTPFLARIYFRIGWENLLIFLVFMGALANVIARLALILERKGKIEFSD